MPPGYVFDRVLGSGGFGEVVLARQTSLGRLVAIKQIHGFNLSDEALLRFRREGRLLAAIDHPAVVRVYDLVDHDGVLHLVMEYVPGRSLADIAADGGLTATAALVILRDVAEALRAAAALGMVHRDVKPGNVFVLPTGRAKLGDFGLARMTVDPSVFRTQAGPAMGTPAYFPPELSQTDAEPDERSDAYSFAVMAYELLVGRRPYDADDLIALITAHWRLEPPDPATIVPGFPPAATSALLRGLAKDPATRLLPAELVDRLSAVPATDWPAPARTPPPTRGGPAPPTRLALGPPPASAPPAPTAARRRSRRPVILVGAAVAALVVAGAVYAVGDHDSPTKAPLALTGITVSSDPPSGRISCPDNAITFTAEIATNAKAGTVRFQWTQPDGEKQAVSEVAVGAGQDTVEARLRVTVKGSRPLKGDAVITVLSPTALTARSGLRYTCASG